MIRRACLAAFALAGTLARAQQPIVVIRDAGPGAVGHYLQATLDKPDTRVIVEDTLTVARDSTFPGAVVVIGRRADIRGTVRGDVIVVAGDLFMHPGGRITGSAIALGGGVYESMLASIGGGVRAFRDFTYDITPAADGFALAYRPIRLETVPVVDPIGFFGVGRLRYDRSNGLSVPVGVDVNLPGAPLALSPRLTYRSQLGRLDPSLAATYALARHTGLRAAVGRDTYTNERWIRTDRINTFEFFFAGSDARNYYRATRAEAAVTHDWESEAAVIGSYLGARAERARSVRPWPQPTGGPWTLFGRDDVDRALRPNPWIDPGDTYTGIAGVNAVWNGTGVTARGSLDFEAGSGVGAGFGQTTFDGTILFPTFGLQSLEFVGHGVATLGDAPRQRWAYVGGPSSIPTTDMLADGGDQLAFFDARYNIPVERIALPVVGSPVVTLREVLGGAAVGAFPTIHQATGVRVALSFVYVEYLVDPVHHGGHLAGGLTMPR